MRGQNNKNQKGDSMSNVVIFTSKTCGPCKMVKQYLGMKGVGYEEKDVELDENRQTIQSLTGSQMVPVIVTDKGMSVGYNLSSLAEII